MSLVRRAVSGIGMFTIGYWSFQWNGRQASMMARLLVKSPCALRSGGIEGSSGVDQALRMKSIDVTGSEREHTAHISSSRLDTSMSSSTTITSVSYTHLRAH